MGFVQADPIGAPARAQDLILRHRVKGYRAGDLERRYTGAWHRGGFLRRLRLRDARVQALMHPRFDVRVPAEGMAALTAKERRTAQLLLEFVESRGAAHPAT